MNFVLFLLAAYGVCFGLMNDKIPFFPYLRKIPLFPDLEGKTFFSRMFDCPYCTGFHAGWVVWALTRLQEHLTKDICWTLLVGEVLGYAFAASAFCYFLDTLVIFVEKKTPQ